MTVRSPASRHWSLWPVTMPVSRLRLELTRTHVIVLAVSLYVVVLLLFYLHLAGQLAAVRYETVLLERRWQALRTENAALQAEVSDRLAVTALIEWAASREATASTLPMPAPQAPVAMRGDRVGIPSARAPTGHSYLQDWARALGLKK